MRYQAVIFDFDYTLGDATQAIYIGICHALRTMGLPTPDWEAVRQTMGLPIQDAFTQLTGEAGPGARAEFYRLFHPVARDLQAAGHVRLFPGAGALLEALHRQGIPLAVVSTKNTDSLESVLTATRLRPLLAYVVGADQVSRCKPDPEGLLWVLSQLGLAPGQVLYCGDTVIDAQAAQAAGTDFCAVLNGTTPAEAFDPYPAVFLARDLNRLHTWLKLPPVHPALHEV